MTYKKIKLKLLIEYKVEQKIKQIDERKKLKRFKQDSGVMGLHRAPSRN